MAKSTNSRASLELPDELLGVIVTKLPLLCMFQLRLVCKHWNIALHDTNFLEKHFQLASRAPYYIWPTEEGHAAYSPEINIWHLWPTSLILMEDRYKIWRGVDGLLLGYGHKTNSKWPLYLANPMTRSYRKVPNGQNVGTMGMVFDEDSKSYKIFGSKYGLRTNGDGKDFVDSSSEDEGESGQQTLYVYDSDVDSSKSAGEMWSGISGFDGLTLHQGVLHCLRTDLISEFGTMNHKVFHFEGGRSWRQLGVARTPRGLRFKHLFERQGNLMVVGGRLSEDFENLSSVEIWHLNDEKNVWMISSTMLDDLLHRFCPLDSKRRLYLQILSHSSAEYIYFTSYSLPFKFVRHVMCRLSKSSWCEVPEIPSMFKGSSPFRADFGCFMWKPSFDKI